MKGTNKWKLYTQIGEKPGSSRYFCFKTFEECIEELKILSQNKSILVLDQKEYKKLIPHYEKL